MCIRDSIYTNPAFVVQKLSRIRRFHVNTVQELWLLTIMSGKALNMKPFSTWLPMGLFSQMFCKQCHSFFRPHCNRCGLLLQMSHVAWSVCLSAWQTGEPCENGWIDRDAVWWADLFGPKKPCITWVRDPSNGMGQFWGLCGPLRSSGSLLWCMQQKASLTPQ